jgi:hypothetical protein
VLEIPLGTVKSRVHRGRVALARAMGLGERLSPASAPDPEHRREPDPTAPASEEER